jgi:hypothetical protein
MIGDRRWGRSFVGTTANLRYRAILDNRDIVLTRWRRSDVNPISAAGQTFGNVVYDQVADVWRQFSHGQVDNKIYQITSTNSRIYGEPILALDLGAGGSWDDASIGVPFVWCETGETRPWRMIYRGASAADTDLQLGLATSLDGVTWERKDTAGNVLSAPVLSKAISGFGAVAIDFGGILKDGSTYYLYYNNISTSVRKIRLATSTDLVTWTPHAENPLYIGTVGEDVDGATADDNQGRFCADIVRWDKPDGTVRYVMFVPHYIGEHTTPEQEVYTCPSPIFLRANRSFVGTMFRTATTPASQQNGKYINSSGTDTPRLVTNDINRNVVTSSLTGHEVQAVVAMYVDLFGWTHELLIHDRTLAGKLEPDGTLAGCKLINVSADLPVSAPVFRLAPKGSDANVLGLWLPGQTGTMLDFSGNGIHMGAANGIVIDARGLKKVSTVSNSVARVPSVGNLTDPVVSVLEANRTDFSIEFTVEFADHWDSGIRYIYYHGASTTVRHINAYITGGEENYTLSIGLRSGSLSKTFSPTFPVASVELNTPIRFAICNNRVANDNVYIFRDGDLLLSGAFNWTIDDFSATDPPLPVAIGSIASGGSAWGGYIDELRVSNVCRHTENYTPANFVINYQSSGQIFMPVYDAGADKLGRLDLQNAVLPAGTSITVTARNAESLDDQSVDAGAFTLDVPTGRYHQYLITFATTDPTVTPSITGAVPMVFG